jgi:hypothetical protein
MSEPYGPEDFGGTDEGSHYCSTGVTLPAKDAGRVWCISCGNWCDGGEECPCRPATVRKQPEPKPGSGDMWACVIGDMHARRVLGIERYGTVLQANNGRDVLMDAYHEALDLAVYLRQAIEERRIEREGK